MILTQKTSKRIAIGTIILAALLASLAFLIKPRPQITDIVVIQLRAATALLVTITSLGGSILFLGGIRQFKALMQQAYTLMASGIILFGVALLQLPVIGFFDLWNSFWANSGLIIAPFIFSAGLVYAGMRRFSKLLGIKNILTSAWITFGFTIVMTVLSFFGGHYIARYHYIAGTDAYIAIVSWSASYFTYSAILSRFVLERVGPFYQDAMAWSSRALIVLSLSAWHEYTINYFMNNDTWYVSHGVSFIPFIISGIVIVRAGYAFSLVGTSIPVIPVKSAPEEPVANPYVTSLESIAALVSKTSVASPILQTVEATSTQAAASPTDASIKIRAVADYKKLENYLIHDEPLRTFNKEELRSKLDPKMRAAVEGKKDEEAVSEEELLRRLRNL